MRCPSCGSRIRRDLARCPSCGAQLDSATASFGGAARDVRTAWGLAVQETASAPKGARRTSRYLVFAIVGLALVALTLVAVLALQRTTEVRAGVAIDAEAFPDEVFRNVVAGYDANGDGALSNREQESATSLSIESPATEDLTGLSWLTSLTTLDISGTRVSALDAAKLPKSLTTLVACDCDIATADLSGMERLISLDLSGNPLRSIRLEGLAGLTTLDLSDCALTGTLSVAGAPALVWLDVSGNPGLAALDATAAPALAGSEAIAADEGCAVSVASTELLEPQGGETSEPVSDETANTVS